MASAFQQRAMYVDSAAQDEEAEGGQTMRGVVGGTKLFNRFTLQKVLGRGGMGIVWLARDDRLDRLVALKLVPEAVCFDASAQEDLKRETRKSLLLTHPHIVRIFDFIEDEHSAGISMEYVDGSTLSYLRVQKPAKCFEVDELRPWISSLCDALGYAHSSAQLVHRDLKPANLMVNSKSDLKVTDFGIACTLRDSMSCVSVRTSSGTLNYMSPQQMLGEDPAASDDIYAMGATLYELLSSKPPFHGGDVASQVREVTAPLIAHRRSKFQIVGQPIPKYWEETIAACLAKDPARRPQTAAEVARRLRIGGTIRMAPRPEPVKRIKPVHMAAIGGGVFAIALAAFLLHRPASDKPKLAEDAKVSPAVGYALEGKGPKSAPLKAAPESSQEVQTSEPLLQPVQTKIGSLEVITSPPGATYSIYAGVVASKSAPVVGALRTGVAPGAVAELPGGRYTVFFHKDGWPDDRTEVALEAGETLPLNYSFPHGTVTVTSNPDGAEIFLGATSLGTTPLTTEIPAGKQQLIARVEDRSDRTQSVVVEDGKAATVAFQFTSRSQSSSRSRTRSTPPPSLMGKVGESLKHVFSGSSTPPPKRRR